MNLIHSKDFILTKTTDFFYHSTKKLFKKTMKFELNEKELEKLREITSAIKLLFEDYDIEYRFSTSAVGHTINIYCKQTDREYNITDYDSW